MLDYKEARRPTPFLLHHSFIRPLPPAPHKQVNVLDYKERPGSTKDFVQAEVRSWGEGGKKGFGYHYRRGWDDETHAALA